MLRRVFGIRNAVCINVLSEYDFFATTSAHREIVSCVLLFITLSQSGLAQGRCIPCSFQDATLFGGKILNVATQTYTNLSFDVPAAQNHYAKNVTGFDVCEVVVTYIHPGYNDTINTEMPRRRFHHGCRVK